MLFDTVNEEIIENPDKCNFSNFNLNSIKSQYLEDQKPILNLPATLENISKVFTFETEKNGPFLASIDDKLESHSNENIYNKSFFIFGSEEILNRNDDKINTTISKIFDHIFEILSKIKYPEKKMKEIKIDVITQKDLENISLFDIKIKKNKNKNKTTIEKKEKKEKEKIKENKEVKLGRK